MVHAERVGVRGGVEYHLRLTDEASFDESLSIPLAVMFA
jgi:hypothetical protein